MGLQRVRHDFVVKQQQKYIFTHITTFFLKRFKEAMPYIHMNRIQGQK